MRDYVRVPHRVRSLQRVVVTLTALTLVGCASMQNTPQQNYVYEVGRGCDGASGTVRLDRVEADGHYWSTPSNPVEHSRWLACMQEQFKAHLALHYMHYNFGRIHKTLRVTPAMEAGKADHVWSLEEIASLPQ